MRCQIFRQIVQKFRRLTYVEGFLCKMTENMQADVALSRKAVFVRCCLNNGRRSASFLTDGAAYLFVHSVLHVRRRSDRYE